MRLRSMVIPLLLLAASSRALPFSTVHLGASVENTRFESDSKAAFVRVVNHSEKPITAFNLSVDVTFTNGKVDHFEHMLDMLAPIIESGKGALAPNQDQEVRIDTSHSMVSIYVKIDMVAYLDLSAEIDGNQDALDRLALQRKNRALAAQQIGIVISEATASSVTPDAPGMAVNRLRELLNEAKSRHDNYGAIEFELAINALESSEVKADLKGYARRKNETAEATLAHANLRRTN